MIVSSMQFESMNMASMYMPSTLAYSQSMGIILTEFTSLKAAHTLLAGSFPAFPDEDDPFDKRPCITSETLA